MFECLRVLFAENPDLGAQLACLVMLKYWSFLFLYGMFVYLVYFGDAKLSHRSDFRTGSAPWTWKSFKF
ncbi:MAG: hypothetical protein ACRED0_04105 [Gammaproteobacteria bacterium]